ncbi:MAG: exodeoxyribonuclease VII large subunit [Gudongella sp.]|jgi:exodeoxyribonuclease VII large subunit|nr:exodeoxyribonuclease VII large subunit [Gudongella sp.]
MKPLLVSELNNYIKKVFASDILLTYLSIEGEISNFTHHYSGHMYFSLKDEKSRIKCVMFKYDNNDLDFTPKNGQKVVVTGSVSVYEKDGSYQFYAKKMEKQGLGELYKAFEELKKKLSDEGLFDLDTKKELPWLPKKIGIVTSSTGAAIRDITSIIKRRWPAADMLLYPALVQGNEAAKDIIKGLKYLDSRNDVDLIIVGRGGGSFEELNAFNDEDLARTIYSLEKPVISAVGHETDFTIADFVADVRAATPSAAAELSVPDKRAVLDELNSYGRDAMGILNIRLSRESEALESIKRALNYTNPVKRLADRSIELDMLFKQMEHSLFRKFTRLDSELSQCKNRLQISNPYLPLTKGYGMVLNEKGEIIRGVGELVQNQSIRVRLRDGNVAAQVTDIYEEDVR